MTNKGRFYRIMARIPSETEMKISPAFQKRLLEIIEDHECNKYEFASFVGISKGVITRATIYGIVPSLQSLIKIADKLDISLEYLLGNNKDNFYRADSPTNFYSRLEQLRGTQKYSEIARKMPFPENFFYEWKRRGTIPSLENLIAIAQYFDVSTWSY